MPMKVVVGAQWGDEGKGKIVDLLAEEADVVARYGGGANAGHTVWVNGVKYVTHLLPSGILQGKVCVLGAGMVIDPKQLLEEIADFSGKGMGVSPEQIMISPAAHIVLPSHKALDAAYEKSRVGNAIGTTKRGIGPVYADKARRRSLRAEMMRDPKQFGQQVYSLALTHAIELMELYGDKPNDISPLEISLNYEEYARQLAEYVQDTSLFLDQCLKEGKTVLAEGAQGTLLDVDHGGYPFVTSSSTVAGAASTGLGVGPRWISRVVGVAKCFQTRVGEGPMPTEIKSDEVPLISHLRGENGQPGSEFGATTGRPRRVGWLDLPLLRYAVRINSLDEIALTKLDTLSGLASIKLCVGYENRQYGMPPTPIYEEVVGWSEDISHVRDFKDLPINAQIYVRRIEDLVDKQVSMISVGTDRDQIIRR